MNPFTALDVFAAVRARLAALVSTTRPRPSLGAWLESMEG